MIIYKLKKVNGYFRMKNTFKKQFVPSPNSNYFFTNKKRIALDMVNEKIEIFEDQNKREVFDKSITSILNEIHLLRKKCYIKFEYNSVIDGINAILYVNNKHKKTFVNLTKRKALFELYKYILGDEDG